MGRLEGKVCLVTGASRGIGRAIALAFAQEGADVALTARTVAGLEKTAADARALGVQAVVVPADVASEADVETVFQRTVDRFGRLDVLVNNAGAFDGGPLDELPLETWNKVLGINLTGPFLCTRAALRIMKPQGVGRIINVSSVSAYRVRPGTGAYSATKAALLGLTQVTALEGREHGITCGCLLPGNTDVGRPGNRNPPEAKMAASSLAEVAVTMAALPPDVQFLEAVVLPRLMPYLGRG